MFGSALWWAQLPHRCEHPAEHDEPGVGAARESAVFAVAPFVGALVAFAALGEHLSALDRVAGVLLAGGLGAMVADRHAHEHRHAPFEHHHRHRHDDRHQHTTRGTTPTASPTATRTDTSRSPTPTSATSATGTRTDSEPAWVTPAHARGGARRGVPLLPHTQAQPFM